ncbi:serine hydrolase [Bosea vestrisii]|uniref:D-alanyl-D-alanine carboxypeptidase family protein n=1 Tax=Bosea vestrisii TaxID=151416 RepID=UPI0024E02F5E|nr:serine hydrolase [Bosea vestrisii]WID98179.1 serine hydrolase [Bosea vestrisii]
MISFRLAAGATFASLLAVAAPAEAGTSVVVDASSGAVLSSESPTQAWHPASTTKMMTLYLALKAVREGKIGLETAIPASKRAASQPRVKVYIKAGQEITLDNAMRIMMVKSANDIAYVIAEGVGGDVETFVSMMNAEAQRLGMRDSHFVNPNGWHHPDQQTSARDLAVLAMALMNEFSQYSDYWNTGAVQLGKQVLNNTNGLVGRYYGISGMKTGFVCASGFNVVSTATRNGRTLIAVVMGATSGAERTVKAAQLLDDGFGKWGGFGGSISSMSSGNGGRAYSICDSVRRGGHALGDDAETAGPISFTSSNFSLGGNAEGTSDRFAVAVPQGGASGSVLGRSPSGRITLGPRVKFDPVQVSFGRSPGSASAPLAANAVARPETQVARETIKPGAPVAAGLVAGSRTFSGNGAIPPSSSAFAPVTPTPEERPAAAALGSGPMRLQGAIQPGAATPTSLRPGAAAGIKAANKPAAKPLLTKPTSDKAAPAKAKPSQAQAKPLAKPPARPGAKPAAKPDTNKPDA